MLEQFDGDNEKLMAWAKSEAAKETELYNERTGKVTVEFSQAACIPMNEARSFHAGYLFLQQLCTELRLDNICRVIKGHHKFKYDLHAILTDLVYARVLSPSSRFSSYNFCKTLLEPPKYEIQDVYRALSVIAEESDLSKVNYTKIQTSSIQEIRRYSTMTVRIITLRLRKKAV